MGKLLRRHNIAFNVTGDSSSLFNATQGTARELLTDLIEALPGESGASPPVEGAAVEPATFDRVPLWAAEAEERGLLGHGKKRAYLIHTQVSSLLRDAATRGKGSNVVGPMSLLSSVFISPSAGSCVCPCGLCSCLSLPLSISHSYHGSNWCLICKPHLLWCTTAKSLARYMFRPFVSVSPPQVTDTCLATPFLPHGAPIVGSDIVGASYLETTFLWNVVRERQGAYGAWSFIKFEGLITFMSFRDPQALHTLEAFRSTPTAAMAFAEEAEEGQILEAVLPAISRIDLPEAVDKKGRTSFWQWVRREIQEHRNTYRQQIINTNQQQLKAFTKRLKEALKPKREAVTLIGPEAAAEEVNESGEALEMIRVQ